ncbi:MAG: phosphatase PAP2 family protein, partial [Bacteroidales bacterium]|nr:phosphatase PAP2 family protein [Bacteroidales bacterium]
KQLGINIYQVPGIELHSHHSFPSGHTATAFALFFGLSLFVKNQWYKSSLLLFATLIGYSRIYLGQHFPADVIAGSVIGIFTSIFLFSRLTNWTSPFLEKNIQMIVRKL